MYPADAASPLRRPPLIPTLQLACRAVRGPGLRLHVYLRMMMSERKKKLIVVGDRVLIQPEEGEDRTKVGLYLPATAVDNQAVQGGTVVTTGPGNALSAPTEIDDEPWKVGAPEPRYLPVQARVGDYAIFFRRAAVEITFDGDHYLVVPQAAILTLVREEAEEDEGDEGGLSF